MKLHLNRIVRGFATCALLAAGPAIAGLPPGISGAWYNPEQSGHGLSIDVISRDTAIVSWAAMDLDGNPFNLYIQARIDGESLAGRALAPRGLRFGEWDRADLQVPDWGEVRIDFSDCNRATLSWTPDGTAGAGFPAGSMPLRRLTQLAGVRCDFGRASDPPLPVGTLALKVRRPHESFLFQYDRTTYAAIDPEGRLWSTESWQALPGEPPKFPIRESVGSVSDPWPKVIVGAPVAEGGGSIALDVRRLTAGWLIPGARRDATGSIVPGPAGTLHGEAFPTRAADFHSISFTSAEVLGNYPAALVPVDRTLDFAGHYHVTLSTQFFDFTGAIVVDAQGGICVQRNRFRPRDPCFQEGQLQLAFTGAPFFDFTLREPSAVAGGPTLTYSGRGWLQSSSQDPLREVLVLVGRGDGDLAIGLAGQRE
jgi:hypothetical protein